MTFINNNKSMTSRERVLTALNHMEPDRIPVDLGSHRSSGIAAIAYHRLRKHLGLEEKPVRVYDMVQQLAVVDEDVLDLFGVDVVEMGRGFLLDDGDWKPWILPDGTPCEIPYYTQLEKRGEDWFILDKEGRDMGVLKKGSLYFEQVFYPLMDRGIENDHFEDLEEMLGRQMWSAVVHPGAHLEMDEKGLDEMAARIKTFRESTIGPLLACLAEICLRFPKCFTAWIITCWLRACTRIRWLSFLRSLQPFT